MVTQIFEGQEYVREIAEDIEKAVSNILFGQYHSVRNDIRVLWNKIRHKPLLNQVSKGGIESRILESIESIIIDSKEEVMRYDDLEKVHALEQTLERIKTQAHENIPYLMDNYEKYVSKGSLWNIMDLEKTVPPISITCLIGGIYLSLTAKSVELAFTGVGLFIMGLSYPLFVSLYNSEVFNKEAKRKTILEEAIGEYKSILYSEG